MSINSDYNLVDLPNCLHWYLHTYAYYYEVNVAVMLAYYESGGSLDAVIDTLETIADTLEDAGAECSAL